MAFVKDSQLILGRNVALPARTGWTRVARRRNLVPPFQTLALSVIKDMPRQNRSFSRP